MATELTTADLWKKCDACEGKGRIIKPTWSTDCEACAGTGKVATPAGKAIYEFMHLAEVGQIKL